VLAALIAAIILGVLIAATHNATLARAADAVAPIGTLWVNAIRMTVIPLVISLLITGVASAADIKAIGRIGGRTLLTFVLLASGVPRGVMPVAPALLAILPNHRPHQLPARAVEAAHELSPRVQAQTYSAWLTSLLPSDPIRAV